MKEFLKYTIYMMDQLFDHLATKVNDTPKPLILFFL